MEGYLYAQSCSPQTDNLCHGSERVNTLSILLRIVCTLPVTSTECERYAGVLRRIHNFMRAWMTENRLTSLALMHIHYQHPVDLDTVVQL